MIKPHMGFSAVVRWYIYIDTYIGGFTHGWGPKMRFILCIK